MGRKPARHWQHSAKLLTCLARSKRSLSCIKGNRRTSQMRRSPWQRREDVTGWMSARNACMRPGISPSKPPLFAYDPTTWRTLYPNPMGVLVEKKRAELDDFHCRSTVGPACSVLYFYQKSYRKSYRYPTDALSTQNVQHRSTAVNGKLRSNRCCIGICVPRSHKLTLSAARSD